MLEMSNMHSEITCFWISGICILLIMNLTSAHDIQEACGDVKLSTDGGRVFSEPNTTVTFNCTFVYLKEGEVSIVRYLDSSRSLIFARIYMGNTVEIGKGYEDVVIGNKTGSQWLTIDLIIPYCSDGVISCEVADSKIKTKQCTNKYAFGVPPRNVGLYSLNDTKIEELKQEELTQNITCKALGIAPNVTSYDKSTGCTVKGDPISKYNATTCLYDWTLKMNCTGEKDEVWCKVSNGIGKEFNATAQIIRNTKNAASTTGGLAWLIIVFMVLAQVIEET